ncbi:DUF2304 domain-containing protein [Actinomycetospora callitridis]|uniref:DUF2304 domain-containing protein n=1 Tax=Actinomycetospora callitridis TaxID=913944 RepID=UPI0023655A63|nr:DUF2304 domain-containing protein [Actinomycetospora callitridis]MDD7920221.1 DUF2304 domain-containing protein [Actinomycetospora callitridis]
MARVTIVTIVVAVAAILLVFELLRGRRLRQKYAFLWVVVAGVAAVISIFPALLQRASALLGIAVPSNLLFLVSLLILFGVSLQLSIEVGVLEEQARRLAEEVGAMRLRLEDVEWRARAEPQMQMGAGTASSSEADLDETGVGRGREVGLPQPVVDQQLLLRRQPRGQAAAGGA